MDQEFKIQVLLSFLLQYFNFRSSGFLEVPCPLQEIDQESDQPSRLLQAHRPACDAPSLAPPLQSAEANDRIDMNDLCSLLTCAPGEVESAEQGRKLMAMEKALEQRFPVRSLRERRLVSSRVLLVVDEVARVPSRSADGAASSVSTTGERTEKREREKEDEEEREKAMERRSRSSSPLPTRFSLTLLTSSWSYALLSHLIFVLIGHVDWLLTVPVLWTQHTNLKLIRNSCGEVVSQHTCSHGPSQLQRRPREKHGASQCNSCHSLHRSLFSIRPSPLRPLCPLSVRSCGEPVHTRPVINEAPLAPTKLFFGRKKRVGVVVRSTACIVLTFVATDLRDRPSKSSRNISCWRTRRATCFLIYCRCRTTGVGVGVGVVVVRVYVVCRVLSCPVLSCPVLSCPVAVASRRVASRRVASRRVASRRVACHVCRVCLVCVSCVVCWCVLGREVGRRRGREEERERNRERE